MPKGGGTPAPPPASATRPPTPTCSPQQLLVNDENYSEMCSGSEAGSYSRLIDFVYHSTLGLRVIKKKEKKSRIRRARLTPASDLATACKEGRCKATWKREFKLPWREAGPPNQRLTPASGLATACKEGRCKATWKREVKLPWREAGPPNQRLTPASGLATAWGIGD